MNKGELVDTVAEKSSVTKKQADAVISAAVESIMEAVSKGEKVTLVGFAHSNLALAKNVRAAILKLAIRW